MRKFQAQWQGQSVQVELIGNTLHFQESQRWPVKELTLSAQGRELVLTSQEQHLQTSHWQVLNALFPHLTPAQRPQAEALLQEHQGNGSRLVVYLLLAIVGIGGTIGAVFWGQIQLRQQQLKATSPEIQQALGEKHVQALQKERRCTSPAWKAPLNETLSYYQELTGSQKIQRMCILGTLQPRTLMLSEGTFCVSAGFLRDLNMSGLLGLMAHQEGHLQANHRLEARIYEQGNSIFKRLWQGNADSQFLMNAPLWVNYSRGQEAAADQWALQHLSHLESSHQGHLKSLVKVWSRYIQSDSPPGESTFTVRHPLATDRLQGLDQLPDPPVLPGGLQNTMDNLHMQARDCLQN